MSLDRKLHWSWQFFDESEEEIDGKTVAVTHCKFCTQRYRDNATKMTKHLIEQCRKIGQEARNTIKMLASIKQKTDKPPSNTESLTPRIASFMDRVSEREQDDFD